MCLIGVYSRYLIKMLIMEGKNRINKIIVDFFCNVGFIFILCLWNIVLIINFVSY